MKHLTRKSTERILPCKVLYFKTEVSEIGRTKEYDNSKLKSENENDSCSEKEIENRLILSSNIDFRAEPINLRIFQIYRNLHSFS